MSVERAICLIAFLSLYLMTISSFDPAIHGLPENGVIEVPYSDNIPAVDGKWSTTTEWTDASDTLIEDKFGWTFHLMLKHNQTYLFILIDFITDQSKELYDVMSVFLDSLDNGGNSPQVDDYMVSLHYYHIYMVTSYERMSLYQGTAEKWNEIDFGGTLEGHWGTQISLPHHRGFKGVKGFSSLNDPYESYRDHRVYELQVPLKFLGDASRFGFATTVKDSTTGKKLYWPTEGVFAPGVWGDAIVQPMPDMTPPNVNILSPSESYLKDNNVLIGWVGSDNIAIDHYELFVDEESYGITASSSETLSLSEGEHTVKVIAYDTSHNTKSSQVTFIMDATKPKVQIISPEDGTTVSMSIAKIFGAPLSIPRISITFSGQDALSGIDYYQVLVDGISKGITTKTSMNIEVADDVYIIKVIAYDRAGNSDQSEISITVQRQGTDYGIFIALGVIAVVAMAIILNRRIKGHTLDKQERNTTSN